LHLGINLFEKAYMGGLTRTYTTERATGHHSLYPIVDKELNPPSLSEGAISETRQNRLLSAGMPLVEGVGGPILPEDCQDQNHKRKFAHSPGFSGDVSIFPEYACSFNTLPSSCLIRANDI